MSMEDIEKKWQARWREAGVFDAPTEPGEDKFYLMEMFAYPSGDVHMGHFRNYSIGDLVYRYKRMQGKKILHPFGWDSFGLPAEQAAIKRKIHPGQWTEKNIATGKSTLQALGVSYDWGREIATSRPDYYKWTQWVFVELYKMGLAYQKEASVNWCPECNTVLANEQVVAGCCWRHEDTPVQRKSLKQWFFKITDYAQRLLDDLDKLDQWPDAVKNIQRYWIGRSEGANIRFTIAETGDELPIFTTRPDTVYGVTFMAIAPEAELMKRLIARCPNRAEVEKYIANSASKSEIERVAEDREKDGMFTGLHVRNPYNGDLVPLFVADYVLAGYGSGAVMAVPAHDQRDFEFARKYGIEIKIVISPKEGVLDPVEMAEAFTLPGIMANSCGFDGQSSIEAKRAIVEFGEREGFAETAIQFRLRDWLISRQRYWGAPIPIVHCERCGTVSVPEEQLPVILPHVDDFLPKGRSPLADVPEFMNTVCPLCGGPALRDPDTMDTYVCSSWYELRYLDPRNESAPFDIAEAKKWLPVDMYIGGIEHATSHLLYFRFIAKVLFDLGYLPVDEPVVKLFNHGMVCDVNGDKMSKSKGNVISPMEIANKHGVDVSRTAMLFFAPPAHEISWNEDGMKGAERFLRKIDNFVAEGISRDRVAGALENMTPRDAELFKALNRTVKAVTGDIEGMSYNTAIARLMEFMNLISVEDMAESGIAFTIADTLARLIAPIAPHLAEELNERLGFEPFVIDRPWPSWVESLTVLDSIEIGVQVNGKLRGTIEIPTDSDKEGAMAVATQVPNIAKHLEDKKIAQVIYIRGRILNIIVK